MCRIAAYFGPATPLDRLLGDPAHGLTDQSRNAREMADSAVAGDGWGIGWFGPEPARQVGLIKDILPIWGDRNARTAPAAIESRSIVGHIRHASGGTEVCFTNTPLYLLDEDSLWTVNGELQPWPGPLAMALRNRIAPEHEAAVQGNTDAELLGAL